MATSSITTNFHTDDPKAAKRAFIRRVARRAVLVVICASMPFWGFAVGEDVTAKIMPDISSFAPNGTLALGANYWASKTATRMWQDWQPDEIAKDLEVLKRHGFTFLRVFPRWDVFQPIWEAHQPGRETYETYLTQDELPRPETPAGYAGVDERMMVRFETFCNLCDERGFKLIVCILTGQMTFRVYTPQALERRDLYADPVALKWERRFIDYFVRRMKHHRAIAAWESGNETCCLGKIGSADAVEAWLAFIHGTIRLADPTRPVIGPNAEGVTSGKWRIDRIAPLSDVVSIHPYNMWTKAFLDSGNGIRNALFAPSENLGVEHIGGKPCFVEEHGIRRAECTSKANVARYARGLCWNLWSSGCHGLGWWCAFDQDNQMIPPYDWKEPYLELGAFKSDRTPYPVAQTLGRFMAFLKTLPFATLPPARQDCVVIVRDMEMMNATYVLCRQAGLHPRFASPLEKLPDSLVYFLPDARQRAHLTLRRWNELKDRVRNGATLALSWNDTFLSDHEAVFGAEITDRTPGCPVFTPITAEVLEKDEDGNPELMRNRYGKGFVYVRSRPLAAACNARTGGFENDSWREYARVCPKRLLVEDDFRDVTTSEHCFDDGTIAVILVNNSPALCAFAPRIANGWHVKAAYTDEAAVWKDGAIQLEGNAGILLHLAEDSK